MLDTMRLVFRNTRWQLCLANDRGFPIGFLIIPDLPVFVNIHFHHFFRRIFVIKITPKNSCRKIGIFLSFFTSDMQLRLMS